MSGPSGNNSVIPVVLFAYARPDHLRQTLGSLKTNRIPLIYAFSDGPRTPANFPAVNMVREMLRSIDWCEMRLCERETNLGLGRSILTGVTEVFRHHEASIVFEDDLVCVPGTYEFICEALRYYQNDPRVMSVSGWTHPLVTPKNVGDQPYFDGRADCWVWGSWARAWDGMGKDARALIRECQSQRIDIYRYGIDLAQMAEVELQQNIWAVRFLYWHILRRGQCLRPPWSMVEHIGFDALATNANDGGRWANPPLRSCPPIPTRWPIPLEHPDCALLWRKAYGARRPLPIRLVRFCLHRALSLFHRIRKALAPSGR